MPPPRPKGIGYTTGAAPAARPSSNTPMSERQQMALLIQMTASSSSTDTTRPHAKKNDSRKGEAEIEESNANEKQHEAVDAKDKPAVEDCGLDGKKESTANQEPNAIPNASTSKRSYSDIEDEFEDAAGGDDLKKKKRKDSDSAKDTKNSGLKLSARFDKNSKVSAAAAKASPSANKAVPTILEKEPVELSKSSAVVDIENEAEGSEDYKSNDSLYNGGLKVPPLKIVIPQQNCSIDTDGNVLRTGKIAASRNAALPYVVSSNSDSVDNIISNQCLSPHESPHKVNSCSSAIEEANKANKLFNDEKNLRVLRSSHRSGVASAERSSNNSSPQMQSSSPSPASSNHANENADAKQSYANMTSSPVPQQGQQFDPEAIANVPSPSTSSTSSSKEINSSSNAELHPRKRKIRPKNAEDSLKNAAINVNADSSTNPGGESHPHDNPFTNGFQMFLNIRRQIEKKWKNLYPVKPRPPQGYNEYLLTKRSYLLNETTNVENIEIPNAIPKSMQEIYAKQQNARQELMERHTVEREKLCLNVEQEIIRVHSKAARSISGQSAPYSVCTYLKDDEVYNLFTPEQDEKEKSASARCRFNGRLLLSWLQDVDDKWEKIKEAMVLRHHNEAESLHAVQSMDWSIYSKRHNLCDFVFETDVDKECVPIIHVGDDFDLLPA